MNNLGGVPIDIQLEVTERSSATPQSIWDVIWDLDLYASWNPECVEARWIEPAVSPAVGARFSGRNVMGGHSWTVTCHIIECDAPRHVAWTVMGPDVPSSIWSYQLTPSAGQTVVTQRFVHGPGPSGIRSRIEQEPDQANAIIEARSAMLTANMRTGLRRVLDLAERGKAGSHTA